MKKNFFTEKNLSPIRDFTTYEISVHIFQHQASVFVIYHPDMFNVVITMLNKWLSNY